MKLVAAAAAVTLTGCSTEVQLPAAEGTAFDPIAFFTGPSRGEGTLDLLIGEDVPIRVVSMGRRQGDTLILDQTIWTGDKAPQLRRWTMRRVATNRYAGTLTDAVGPVEGSTKGPRAYIRYTMANGLTVKQQLALQPDGRTLLNRLDVEKFGLRVGTLDETIRKAG